MTTMSSAIWYKSLRGIDKLMSEEEPKEEEELSLEWKDYLAFIIALLGTNLLSFALMTVALFIVGVIIINLV